MDQDKNKNIENEDIIEVDPDYESTNAALRKVQLQEEEDNKLTEEKLRSIIQTNFDKELQIRQKQIEEIEEKVFKAQKLLHIVRYILVSSYYNNKAPELEATSSSSLIDPNILLPGQNRIHPAIKKLLGTNVKDLSFLDKRTKRKATSSKTETTKDLPVQSKKIKLENKNDSTVNETKPEKVENVVEEPVTNRTKVQHKLVIGNISYFKKSLEQNNLTHKWMVYVKIFKGLENETEITDMTISKVAFHLHPSYKPHDVVNISQPPFHLSRRGWGEFPLGVKIYFKSLMNKPVHIIHQLKLDNTFTERQTLGNQTIVPLFLYDEANETKQVNSKDNNLEKALSNEQQVKTEPSASYEHDYCYENTDIKQESIERVDDSTIKEEFTIHPSDHVYSLPAHKKDLQTPKKIKSPVKQDYNELIYGLGLHYLDPHKSRSRNVRPKAVNANNCVENNKKPNQSGLKVLKTVTGQSIRLLPESFNQILLNNGNVVSVKLLKPASSKAVVNLGPSFSNCSSPSVVRSKARQEKHLLKSQLNKFKNMGQALSYLMKRLPLWTGDSNNLEYRCAKSEPEYHSWNIGKRLSVEWSRAKTIKKLVSGEVYSKNWTTKAIFMFARSHLYTPPLPSYRLFVRESLEKTLISNCFRSDSYQNGNLELPQEDININVISPVKQSVIDLESNSIETCVDISDRRLSDQCAFVKEAALDVGIILKPEVLVAGVSMNIAERMILEAVKSFAENLIRRSTNYLVSQPNYNNKMSKITCREVKMALESRTEFESIKRFKENKITRDFFS